MFETVKSDAWLMIARNWNDGCRLHHWGGAGSACLKQYCKEQALFCSIGVCVLVLLFDLCLSFLPLQSKFKHCF